MSSPINIPCVRSVTRYWFVSFKAIQHFCCLLWVSFFAHSKWTDEKSVHMLSIVNNNVSGRTRFVVLFKFIQKHNRFQLDSHIRAFDRRYIRFRRWRETNGIIFTFTKCYPAIRWFECNFQIEFLLIMNSMDFKSTGIAQFAFALHERKQCAESVQNRTQKSVDGIKSNIKYMRFFLHISIHSQMTKHRRSI